MPIEFDPAAMRAILSPEDDHWVVALELAQPGSWGKARTSWTESALSREEVDEEIGEQASADNQEVIGFVEVSLRRAGWRAMRSSERPTPPALEEWDLSPASDYTPRPKHLFS
jgi:hypothetical protein